MRTKKVPKNTKRKDSRRSSNSGKRPDKKLARMGTKELNPWPIDAQELNAKLDQMVAERTAELRALNRELSFKAAELEQKLSEFRQTQKKLSYLASFPEINPNPIVEVNADGSIEYLNPAAKKLFPDLQDVGYQHEWLVDLESIGTLLKDQKKTYSARGVKVNGNWYHQSFHLTPGVDHLRIYGLDITERKQMEEQLRNSRNELEIAVKERTAEISKAYQKLKDQSNILEAFFSSTVTPLVLLDRNFNFVRVNEAYAKACQRDVSEFPGHNHFEFYPSDAKAAFEQVVQTKVTYQAIARPFTFPDHPEWGKTYWNWTLTPILDEEGEVEFLVFSLEDVTERTRAANKLEEQANLLE